MERKGSCQCKNPRLGQTPEPKQHYWFRGSVPGGGFRKVVSESACLKSHRRPTSLSAFCCK
eukprot:2285363-Amphidinium_carterae.1